MPLELTCTNEQKIKVTATPATATGAAAAIDGPLGGETLSGDATVEAHPTDPLSVYVIAGSLLGDSTLKIKGDADLTPGQQEISDLVTLHVVGALAATLGLAAGAPEPKP